MKSFVLPAVGGVFTGKNFFTKKKTLAGVYYIVICSRFVLDHFVRNALCSAVFLHGRTGLQGS